MSSHLRGVESEYDRDVRFLIESFQAGGGTVLNLANGSVTKLGHATAQRTDLDAPNHDQSGPLNSCAACGASAKAACQGCNDYPREASGQPVEIFYCNKECQISHRAQHAAQCKERSAIRTLHRTGDLLRRIFLLLREKFFDDRVVQVARSKSSLVIQHQLMFEHVVYHELPEISSTWSAEEKAAVLTFFMCSYSIGVMWPMVEMLLDGLKIEEIRGVVGRPKLQVFWNTTNYNESHPATKCKHDLWRITTKSGKAYALDLAGAQFGHYQAVTPWDEYMQSLKFHVETVFPPGYNMKNCTPEPFMKRVHWTVGLSIVNDFIIPALHERAKTALKLVKVMRYSRSEHRAKTDKLIGGLAKLLDHALLLQHLGGNSIVKVQNMYLFRASPDTTELLRNIEQNKSSAKISKTTGSHTITEMLIANTVLPNVEAAKAYVEKPTAQKPRMEMIVADCAGCLVACMTSEPCRKCP